MHCTKLESPKYIRDINVIIHSLNVQRYGGNLNKDSSHTDCHSNGKSNAQCGILYLAVVPFDLGLFVCLLFYTICLRPKQQFLRESKQREKTQKGVYSEEFKLSILFLFFFI
jgi:hypothetical protein